MALQTPLRNQARLPGTAGLPGWGLETLRAFFVPLHSGYVEAPAGPPANPYAMPPGQRSWCQQSFVNRCPADKIAASGGPYGGSANPYANQSTASVPRPVETAPCRRIETGTTIPR